MGEESEIAAVHDKDLDRVLRDLNLLPRVQAGSTRCGVCDRTVTRENLGCIYMGKHGIEVCCDDHRCCAEVRPVSGESRG